MENVCSFVCSFVCPPHLGEPLWVPDPIHGGSVVCEQIDVIGPVQRVHPAVQTAGGFIVYDSTWVQFNFMQPTGEVVDLDGPGFHDASLGDVHDHRGSVGGLTINVGQ